MTNLIEDIGFTNPELKPTWNNITDGYNSQELYAGQLDPKWRENAQNVLDEQRQVMEDLENDASKKGLPKEILIFGVGTLILLTFLIINKYKSK